MGMYTEMFFRATLKKSTPEDVLSALEVMAGQKQPDPSKPLPKHELFECSRWDMLGCSSSYYFPDHARSFLAFEDIRKQWSVLLNGDLKNYGGEIDLFFDWINPFVDAAPGEFLGYSLYEDVDPGTPPTNYFKN